MEILVDYDSDAGPICYMREIIDEYDPNAWFIGHERTHKTSILVSDVLVSDSVDVEDLERKLNKAGFRVLSIAA